MKNNLIYFIFMYTAIIQGQALQSPSHDVEIRFRLEANGTPVYNVNYKNKATVSESKLGFQLTDGKTLSDGFEVIKSTPSTFNESWKPVLGETSSIKNHYNELRVALLQKSSGVKLNIVFRAFDEGVAFRYEFPRQEKLNYFVVSKELTEFRLTDDHKAFWIPGDFDSQEYAYNETKLSEIDVDKIDMNNGIGFKGPMAKTRVQSPLIMKTSDKIYINIFEAAVINYPVMHLTLNPKALTFSATLAPNAIGDLAYLQAPFHSPWRTIMVSDDAREILASKMILNLNEPSKIDDTSWIKPMKFVGIWWEMHVGKATWDYAGSQNAQNSPAGELKPTGKHGATTANAKKYIDFAAKHGFDGVLIEGWNVGWEDWFGNWKEEVFDFVTPYPDFDVKAVTAYAKEKKVQMIMHHETSGSVTNYERRLDRAFDFMKANGYNSVKTGYVGRIIPRGEWHDGQLMVNHYNYVVKRAAEKKIMID